MGQTGARKVTKSIGYNLFYQVLEKYSMEKNVHNLTILNDFSVSWMSVDIYKNISNGEYANIKILEIYSLLKFCI